MAAITLTPIDPFTAPVIVNTEVIYHIYDIAGGSRVFFSKGGNIPYNLDVQGTASSIAAQCPSLIEVGTATGSEYLFIGSGNMGSGKGIIFIEDDPGSKAGGSKILFKYVEEFSPTIIYSTDSPSVLAARINAAGPAPSPGIATYSSTVTLTPSELQNSATTPVTLISAPTNPNQAIEVLSASFQFVGQTTGYDFSLSAQSFVKASSVVLGQTVSMFYMNADLLFSAISPYVSSGYMVKNTDEASNGSFNSSFVAGDSVMFQTGGVDATQGDGDLTIYLTYRYITLN